MPPSVALVHATGPDGVELPVLDVAHPAFAVPDPDRSLASSLEQFLAQSRRMQRLPGFASRLILRLFLRRSRLGRAILGASGGFVTGMDTYLMKLGPDQLPAWATDVDRRIAAGFPSLSMRVRVQDLAQLLVEGLSPVLLQHPGRPLLIVDIAGGACSDAINTCLRLQRESPHLLDGRAVRLLTLDRDAEGAGFAGRCVDALRTTGGPLAGIDLEFRHRPYDWNRAGELARALADAAAPDSILAVTSEGGLFEYGSDEAIVANLSEVATQGPADAIVTGSVTRADGPGRAALTGTRIATRPRTLAAFDALAVRAGWSVDRSIARPISFQVGLRRA